LQTVFPIEFSAGAYDQVKPAPAGVDGLDLLVGAHRSDQCGQEFVAGQLGLGFVVVDVVIADDLKLWGLAGLAGTQDDADFFQSKLPADVIDELQTRVITFHDHIQQDDRDVRGFCQQLACFGCRVSVQDFQWAIQDQGIAQHQHGGVVHILIIIDDQNPPCPLTDLGGLLFGFIGKEQFIVLIGHG